MNFFYKLGIEKSKKIVLVQLNNRKINQSAKPTQAKEFESLFKYLKKKLSNYFDWKRKNAKNF